MKHLFFNLGEDDNLIENELQQFRSFLRKRLDQNKNKDPSNKRKFEVWLDFILLCQTMFKLPLSEEDVQSKLVAIGKLFLGKPPFGYNMAVGSQCKRRELESHCLLLQEKFPLLKPNQSLAKDCFEYIYMKLDQKYEIFRSTM